MTSPTVPTPTSWCANLPVLSGQTVTLREPAVRDLGALHELLSAPDAALFDLEGPLTLLDVHRLVERAARDRAEGTAFTYAIALTALQAVVGLLQVRQLNASFEAAEWECAIAPAARGAGVFVEASRLAVSLAFGAVGVRRLEARVPRQNGRANGALRKIGAVQEGVLRRSGLRQGAYVDHVLWSLLKDDWRDAGGTAESS